MLYKSSYNDITLSVRQNSSQKMARQLFEDLQDHRLNQVDTPIDNSNRHHISGILQDLLKLPEFQLEWYFHVHNVCQLIKGTNHFHKFTVATRGQHFIEKSQPYYHLIEKSNNGYSKVHNCFQSQYKWFNYLQVREFGSN